MAIEYRMTDREVKLLESIADRVAPKFAQLFAQFLRECVEAGVKPTVAGSALSLFVLTNTTRLLTMTSGIPLDELDMETMRDIAARVQEHLTVEVSAYIDNENDKFDPTMN